MDELISSNNELRAILESFIAGQEKIEKQNIQELTEFLNKQYNKELSTDSVNEQVNEILENNRQIQLNRKQLARLFTIDKQVRAIRFGSGFCPNCHMFKNYDKECPYCQFLEMTY